MFRAISRANGPALSDVAEAYPGVAVYGTRWCAASQMVRRCLDRLGVRYVYYDIEQNPAAGNRVRWWTGGYASHPVVQIGGEILVEPALDELHWALAQHGM